MLVIAYIGETPWNSPTVLADQLITNIQRSTSFHGTGDASIVFEMVGGGVNFVYAYPPLAPPSYGGWDLPAIYQQFNICNRVASEGIDEVWIYVDGKPGGHVYGSEWQANGPLWFSGGSYYSIPPNCGKQMFTMGFNFDRGEAEELESWAHSIEISFLLYVSAGTQACDVSKPGNYGDWGSFHMSECVGITGYSATNGLMVLPENANGNIGVCGDVHFPPNVPATHAYALPNPYAYDYDNPDTYPSRCPDWQWNTITNTTPISAGVWGYTEVGYLTWWMQNIPGLNNNLHGRDGTLRPNWWDFRLRR